jgi:hypothetical protein
LTTYPDLVDADRPKAEALMMEAFSNIGEQVKVTEKLAGDLLAVRTGGGTIFPAVYIGNGHAMACFRRTGVQSFPVTDEKIFAVRRPSHG